MSIIVTVMKRMVLVGAVLLLVSGQLVLAQSPDDAWKHRPDVLVIGEESDPRYAMVLEAVEYWNRTLAELGSPFRFGRVSRTAAEIPNAYVLAVSRAIAAGERFNGPPPQVLNKLPGDYIVILSDLDFVSFGGTPLRSGKRVAAIKGAAYSPFTLPNVPLNVIVHELGHGIGLRHNSDPAALMCGRPASCRPDLFQSQEKRIFPLLEGDKAALLKLYPPGWTEKR